MTSMVQPSARMGRSAMIPLLCAAVGLLALGASTVLAQDVSPDPMAPATVTGTTHGCSGMADGLDESGPGGVPNRQVDVVYRCRYWASDPRVRGETTVLIGGESWGPDTSIGTMWVSERLTGPDGSWSGRGYAVRDGEGLPHYMTFLVGDGAYEGLTYVYLMTDSGGPFMGVIYPGDPPAGFPTDLGPMPSPLAW